MKNFIFAVLVVSLCCTMTFAQPGRFDRGGARGSRIEPDDLKFAQGVARIPDRATFEKLSYKGPDVKRDAYLADLEFVKFIIEHPQAKDAKTYFMNTNNYRAHPPYMNMVGIDSRGAVRGAITYLPRLRTGDGSNGLYIVDFQPNDSYKFEEIKYVIETLLKHMPFAKGKISFHPLRGNLRQYELDQAKYEKSGITVHLDEHLYTRIAFLPLNSAESYGLLRVLDGQDFPSPREIVICETLPNQMPRVAGVISAVRQTPLSHVNLRAVQDQVPNAYINNALQDKNIKSLIGQFVHYKVTPDGYSLRKATTAEVDRHFTQLRPTETQTPQRDLTEKSIMALDQIQFADANKFGVKTANLATLRSFKLPEGTVPDGFGIPFYFYHEFMKHNNLYAEFKTIAASAEFQSSRENQQKQLSKFRQKIETANMPQWMLDQLATVQKSFPAETSIRCRSSTNNEDLAHFSGAGLYDSFTHKPSEGHLAKSIKQVYASLWNFRAFEEREFYRIDHQVTAMGVLLHPNFKQEKANGVAVTDDVLYESKGNYYINSLVGEDLVTNPNEKSSPEEILLGWWAQDGHDIVRRSAAVESTEQVLKKPHLENLRKYLGRIHNRFAKLYGKTESDQFAMEVEFKITADDQLVIKQARPWIFGASPE